MTNPHPLNRAHRLEITQDEDGNGEYRWRRHAGNNQIISNSAEGYKKKSDMWHGLEISNVDHESLNIVDHTLLSRSDKESDSPSP